MKKTFDKINIPEQLFEIHPIKIKFDNEEYIYDFSIYGDTKITRLCAKVFHEQNINLSPNTRERAYFATKKFLKFLSENNLCNTENITSQYLISYASYLDIQKISINTKYSNYNQVELIVSGAKKLKNNPLLNLKVPANPFRDIKEERPIPKKITPENLRKILSICYKQIDSFLEEFRSAKQEIKKLKEFFYNGGEFNKKDKYHIIYYFYNKYGYAPIAEQLDYEEKALIRSLRDFSILDNALSPNVYTLLPFYLVLLFDLAANSDALRQITLDCTEEDPLFEDRIFVLWNKNRATSLQKRNVLKNKKYGAYQVIKWVEEITENTRKQINEKEQKYLFICKGLYNSSLFKLVGQRGFEQAIKFFCEKNNLDFTFNPSDIRPTVLTEMYKKRKDVVSVSKIANHKNIETTLLYIVDEETKKLNRIGLAESQDLIVENIVKKEFPENKSNLIANDANSVGFNCKNPIINNKVCINWMNELINPNLIIPENEHYLSKIIALKNEILRVKNFMNNNRYELLYFPILTIINEEIIPIFSEKTIKKAIKLSDKVKIPSLGEL